MAMPWVFARNEHSLVPQTTRADTGSTWGNLLVVFVASWSNAAAALENTPLEAAGLVDDFISESRFDHEWQAFKDMGPGETEALGNAFKAAPEALSYAKAEMGGVFRTGGFLADNTGAIPWGKFVPGAVSTLRPPPPIEGLALQEGQPAAKGFQAHHTLPQADEFAAIWRALKINIEQFRVQLLEGTHLSQLHSNGGIPGIGKGGLWNEAWRQFFLSNQNVTVEAVMAQAAKMIGDFKVPYYSQVPRAK